MSFPDSFPDFFRALWRSLGFIRVNGRSFAVASSDHNLVKTRKMLAPTREVI